MTNYKIRLRRIAYLVKIKMNIEKMYKHFRSNYEVLIFIYV